MSWRAALGLLLVTLPAPCSATPPAVVEAGGPAREQNMAVRCPDPAPDVQTYGAGCEQTPSVDDAHRESSPWVDSQPGNPLRALLPSPGSPWELRTRERQQAIEHALSALPGVQAARVHWAEPHPATVPLDKPLPAPQLSVLLSTTSEAPADGVVRAVLANTGPALPAENVSILRVPYRAPGQPAPLPPAENAALKHALALSLAANVLLATLLLARRRWGAR
jgi:hypothetical protein